MCLQRLTAFRGYFAPHSAQLHGAGDQTDTDLVCTKALWVWDAMCLHTLTAFKRVFCPTQCSTAWSRQSDRHRSGMHQGSVGMGRNVPAQTHIIQGALWVCDAMCLQGLTAFRGCFIHSPPSDWLQRSNVMTAACPSLSRWGTAPSARPSHMLRTDIWWRESCMSLSS